MTWLDEFRRALRLHGVVGSDARRIEAELADHIDSDPDSEDRLGDPVELARAIAAEVATRRTRVATFGSFGALSLTAAAYLAMTALVAQAGGWPDLFAGGVVSLATSLLLVLAPQVALVAGGLALLRALRLRGGPAPAAELGLVRRRAGIALGAGALTSLSLAVWALSVRADVAGWWVALAIVLAASTAASLGVAVTLVRRAGKPLSLVDGPAGDVFDDLPFSLHGRHRRLLTGTALVVGAATFAVGWAAEGDPGSGLVRAGFEAVAVVLCWLALGRSLGLRSSR